MPRHYTIYNPRKAREKHGMTNTRIYRVYKAMRTRCKNPCDSSYKSYGAKGITVCDLWDSSFISFYNWSMENGYNDDLSIDRIDSTKGYSPDNCRWITLRDNCSHKRTNIYLTYNGKTQCISDWVKELDLKMWNLYAAKKRGLSDVDAIEHCILLKRGA